MKKVGEEEIESQTIKYLVNEKSFPVEIKTSYNFLRTSAGIIKNKLKITGKCCF